MSDGHLRKEDTELYKGIGILLVVLHNYFHWVEPSPGENEFTFERDRTIELLRDLQLQPLEAINLLFSYFGHYGVQLFVFLSAYGLARSWAVRRPRWTPFMVQRAKRIYPTFLLAVAAHLICVVTFWNEDLRWFLEAYALVLSLLTAFVPDMQFLLVGPWWFFSFIFQFYAIFPLLNRLASRYGARGLAVVAGAGLVITAVGNTWLVPRGLNLYCTVVGHLPVLCLGIYAARSGRLPTDSRLVFAAAIVFALGTWFKGFWYFAAPCATVLLLAAVPRLVGWLRAWPPAFRFVSYCGAISLPLFAIHGMLRQPFKDAANAQGSWYFTLGAGVAFLAVSLIAAQFMQWIEDLGRRRIEALRASEH